MVGEEVRTEEKEAATRRSEELLRIASTKTFAVAGDGSLGTLLPQVGGDGKKMGESSNTAKVKVWQIK